MKGIRFMSGLRYLRGNEEGVPLGVAEAIIAQHNTTNAIRLNCIIFRFELNQKRILCISNWEVVLE
jgi:hypothetical protein